MTYTLYNMQSRITNTLVQNYIGCFDLYNSENALIDQVKIYQSPISYKSVSYMNEFAPDAKNRKFRNLRFSWSL
jgi:hypothetical protein